MFNFKSYHKAGSIQEAIQLSPGKSRDASYRRRHRCAGQTAQGQRRSFLHLVDIHDIAELNFIIRYGEGDLLIGPGPVLPASLNQR